MTITAMGASGSKHAYEAYLMSTNWNDVAGNYAFAYKKQDGNWHVLYFGQCDSFKNRLPAHERWDEAVRLGATHVLAHVNSGGEAARLAEEKDLIASHSPTMNTHHVRKAG